MNQVFVVEQGIRDRAEIFQLKFAREAAGVLDGDGAAAEATHAGLELRAGNEALLAKAVGALRARYGDDLLVSPPAVLYRREPVLMEPVMAARMTVPLECARAIERNLHGCRAIVLEKRIAGRICRIDAEVPMVNLLGYADYLQDATAGAGSCEINFCRYAPIGPDGSAA